MKSAFFLLLFLCPTLVRTQPPMDGLIACYNFNNNTNDQSGNNYTAELYGGATATGYLMTGDNTDDYLALPPEILNNLGSFAVAFRIRFTSLHISGSSPTNHILSGDISTEQEYFGLAYQRTVTSWRFAFLGELYDFPDTNVELNRWYCFVLQRASDGTITAFKDGTQLPGMYTNTEAVQVTSLLIGQETDCTGGCFSLDQCTNAQLENLAFYNQPLLATEMETLCNPALILKTEELFAAVDFTVYPNPSNSEITVSYDNQLSGPGYSLTLLNPVGQELTHVPFTGQLKLNLSEWGEKGIYIVQITDVSGMVVGLKRVILY